MSRKEKDQTKLRKERELMAIREQNAKLEAELRGVKEMLREIQQMIIRQAPQ